MIGSATTDDITDAEYTRDDIELTLRGRQYVHSVRSCCSSLWQSQNGSQGLGDDKPRLSCPCFLCGPLT